MCTLVRGPPALQSAPLAKAESRPNSCRNAAALRCRNCRAQVDLCSTLLSFRRSVPPGGSTVAGSCAPPTVFATGVRTVSMKPSSESDSALTATCQTCARNNSALPSRAISQTTTSLLGCRFRWHFWPSGPVHSNDELTSTSSAKASVASGESCSLGPCASVAQRSDLLMSSVWRPRNVNSARVAYLVSSAPLLPSATAVR
mmetsp:Transcript_12546/g.24486  ORF Transcript_12546/g.24486 Transcript_12546/m.24486 type:complete len:201 (-) Transcript_12546:2424-3026(-)